MNMNQPVRQRSPIIAGAILIGIGVLLLAGNFLQWRGFELFWPLIVLGVGALFFVGMVAGGKSMGGLAIPGSIISIAGLITLVQSLTNNWLSWTYLWALCAPTGVGIGMLINSWWSNQPALKRSGYTLIIIGMCLFLAFGAFFELFFGKAGIFANNQLFWPVVLIGLGVLVLLGRALNFDNLIDRLPPHPRGPDSHLPNPPAAG